MANPLKDILQTYNNSIALVVGNGINRYNSDTGLNSWDSMLLELWEKHTDDDPKDIPLGISLTEFYDALDLSSTKKTKNLQKEFCSLMQGWKARPHHGSVVNWAKNNSCPILTTNFDETLSEVGDLLLHHWDAVSFTDFYPWASYFAERPISDPAKEFAIWHINGINRYSRSIRLGLSHYMGSVERARTLIHKGKNGRLFAEANHGEWNGRNTWLDCVFHRDLLFIGLGLDTSEVFLRWLLIERAKYFKTFPARKCNAWYVYAGKDISQGQRIFLKSVGCEIIKVPSFDDIYANHW